MDNPNKTQISTSISINQERSSLFSNLSAVSSHLWEMGYPEKSINSMMRCGEPTFVCLVECPKCGEKPLQCYHRCNLRTCDYCSNTRKRRLRRTYLPYLGQFKHNRTYKYRFLTISPKNYDDLEYGLNDIRKTFSKFIRRKYVKERLKAGLYVIEAKRSGLVWNIHIHAIIYSKYLDNRIRGKCLDCGQNLLKVDYVTKNHYCANRNCGSLNVTYKQDSTLVKEWMSSSKGRPVNMDIKGQQGSLLYSLNYMLKYVSVNKSDFLGAKDIAMYICATRKRKLINKFGVFFKLNPKPIVATCNDCGSPTTIIFAYSNNDIVEKPPWRK